VPKLSIKAENVEAIAYYRSQEDLSIYATKEKLGSGEIVYVNVHPVVETVKLSGKKSIFYEALGRLLEPTDTPLESFTYIPPAFSTFKQVKMSGDVEINTSSVLFPLDANLGKVKISRGNNSVTSLFNVTRLQILNYNNISIRASNLTLSDGKGFYSTLNFEGKVVVMPEGDFTLMIESAVNGNVTQSGNVKMIAIEDCNPIVLYVRQPTIEVQGEASFRELYSSRAIYQRLKTLGQDLRITGTVKLTMYLSDVYCWASSLDASGSFERSPPILTYDELSSVPKAVFWGLLLAPIFLIMAFIMKSRRPQNEQGYVMNE